MTHAANPMQIGWREWVGLPDLGVMRLKAKIDTGARTSALHAVHQDPFTRDGEKWISFTIPGENDRKDTPCEALLVGEREIKNTSGIPEMRYVVTTQLLIGRRHWRVEVSLANRANMEFVLILGRTALRDHELLVNPGRSFLTGVPRQIKTSS